MKKFFAMLLALCLLSVPAFADEWAGVEYLDAEIKNEIDLDGDGANETVIIKSEGVSGEEYLALYIFGADGSFHSYDMYVMWLENALAKDINGDGIKELFISCDYYSDDYVTYCFNYTDAEGLRALQFAGIDRYGDGEPYTDGGYGKLTGFRDGWIFLTGSQDVLGTWMTSRDFALVNGRFELVKEGLYVFETAESDWIDRPLILRQDIEVTAEDGSKLPLKAGEKLLPVASDRETFALMTTEGGRTFNFDLEFNDETGWGWFANGVYEDDLFEYVPYAD